MRFRRALVVVDLLADARLAIAALARLAPTLQYVLIVATSQAARRTLFGTPSEPDASDEASAHALERLQKQAHSVAGRSDVQVVFELDGVQLTTLAVDAKIDLLVAGSRSLRDANAIAEAHKRQLLPVLWPPSAADAPSTRAIERVFCVPLGRAGRTSVAEFLRDHGRPSLHVTLLSPAQPGADTLASIVEISGIHATVDAPRAGLLPLRALLANPASHPELDLLVLTRVPNALMLGISWPTPVLLLPSSPAAASRQGVLDVADVIDDAGTLRAHVRFEAVVGALAPAESVQVAFISHGRVVETATTSVYGEIELQIGRDVTSLGVQRSGDTVSGDALASIERRVHVLRPGRLPIMLVDCELSDEALLQLRQHADAEILAVRLRPTSNIRMIRERLRALQLPTHVIDASAVLDEGPAFDVSEVVDPVRLSRVAMRLRRAGFLVASVMHCELTEPEPVVAAAAHVSTGNRIELELDNERARRWLLSAIASSTQSVSFQVYMAADDEVGRAVEAVLCEAALRGVVVRVLVDSLHGLHGSFGAENPVLARLSQQAGIELRTCRPVNQLPSLADLKRRDHCKLVVVDGALALIGGRNLSHEYYTGFDEAVIKATSSWRELPWLDAGARIEGPAVAALAGSFLEAWTEAGGAPFPVAAVPAVGTSTARVIVHRGLRDANTLEAYLELIDTAGSHVNLVSGFPLLLELQHALLRAHARGVRVCVLTGHAAPTHASQPFSGPWAGARAAATELVHSRLDPLVDAGVEVYSFAKRNVPSWAPELGIVHPHVHAKVMSVDGARCSVGSANFDITSSYWESELIAVTEDPELAQALEARIEELIAESTRWDPHDPTWQKLKSRRAWMRHWPGVLSV